MDAPCGMVDALRLSDVRYTFVLQLALKFIVYQYVTDIQGEFWSLVGPEGR